MSNFTVSPNMGLNIPTVGVESGPQYASDVNTSLYTIDAHSHVPGSGVPITPDAININSDLPFNSNNATLLATTRFVSQVTPIANSAPNIGCLYVSGNELYYNDYSGGNQVQITSAGSVNAGAGSITGLPSGTASVTYTSTKYVFQSATSTAATCDMASAILRNTTASSYGLTLMPPTLGANYSLTLPTQPAQTNVMTLTSSGVMGSATYNAIAAAMSNPNFSGNAVQAGGQNIVLCGVNSTNSLQILRGFQSGLGYATVENPTGVYTITFTNAFGDYPAIYVNPIGTLAIAVVSAVTSASSVVVSFYNTSGTLIQVSNFTFMAIGQV